MPKEFRIDTIGLVKKSRAFFLFIIPLLLIAGRAWANPYFFTSRDLIPWFWIMLIPVIFLEAIIMRLLLKTRMIKSLSVTGLVNLGSTSLGAPISWLPGRDLILTFVICYVVAIVSEYFLVRLLLPTTDRRKILKWSLVANTLSYLIILFFTLAFPLLDNVRGGG